MMTATVPTILVKTLNSSTGSHFPAGEEKR